MSWDRRRCGVGWRNGRRKILQSPVDIRYHTLVVTWRAMCSELSNLRSVVPATCSRCKSHSTVFHDCGSIAVVRGMDGHGICLLAVRPRNNIIRRIHHFVLALPCWPDLQIFRTIRKIAKLRDFKPPPILLHWCRWQIPVSPHLTELCTLNYCISGGLFCRPTASSFPWES